MFCFFTRHRNIISANQLENNENQFRCPYSSSIVIVCQGIQQDPSPFVVRRTFQSIIVVVVVVVQALHVDH